MKKQLNFVLGLALGLSLSLPIGTFADSSLKQIEAYLSQDVSIKVDGKQLQMQNTPINYNGSIYLPIRETATAMNKDVKWNDSTQTVELNSQKGGTKVDHKVWYNVLDVYTKYPVALEGYDKEYKAIYIFQDKTVHIKVESAVDANQVVFASQETFLQYMTQEQLNEFQKYSYNNDTKEVTPIN